MSLIYCFHHGGKGRPLGVHWVPTTKGSQFSPDPSLDKSIQDIQSIQFRDESEGKKCCKEFFMSHIYYDQKERAIRCF